jgi:putative transposase
MKDLCKIAGFSKQALWSHARRQQQREATAEAVVNHIKVIRKSHARMGCRRMYYYNPDFSPVGRDIFEQIGLANGFRLKRRFNKRRTTLSQSQEVYTNKIEGKEINGINQVWQSDIFYTKVEGEAYYGVCVEDVYSRTLLALVVSRSLAANQLLKALKMAIAARKGHDLRGCIFHSDRGSQYIDGKVKKLISDQKMIGSMCLLPQENAYVERLQGILQGEYLNEMPMTKENLSRQVRKVLSLYNRKRPHSSLGMMSPQVFEQMTEKMDENSRPVMKIYRWDHGFSTISPVINKKKKEAKKKKST